MVDISGKGIEIKTVISTLFHVLTRNYNNFAKRNLAGNLSSQTTINLQILMHKKSSFSHLPTVRYLSWIKCILGSAYWMMQEVQNSVTNRFLKGTVACDFWRRNPKSHWSTSWNNLDIGRKFSKIYYPILINVQI